MPFVSKAQQGYFNANRDKLEKQGVDVDEWNAASKGLKLPEKADVTKIKRAAQMSSPSGFGAFSPFMDRIRQMYEGGQQVLNHPLDAMRGALPQPPNGHQQAIEDMNRQTNSHNNDPANASFQHQAPNVTTIKKPLGK